MTRLLALAPLLLVGCFSSAPVEHVAVESPKADPLRPDAQGHFVVSMGEVTLDDQVNGPFTNADVGAFASVVERNAGTLQRCYEDRLRAVPDLAGSVIIHTHVTPEGRVDGQCVTEDTVGDPLLRDCVNEVLTRGPYPVGHAVTVDVSVPFVFTPPKRG